MTAEVTPDSQATQGFHLEPRVAKAFLALSARFWIGEPGERHKVRWREPLGLAVAIGLLLLLRSYVEQTGLSNALLVIAGLATAALLYILAREPHHIRRAWYLTLGLAASLIASTYITVQMNHWNRWFFDALEKKDVATVKQAILVFLLIVAVMASIGVLIVVTRETLQVRWRQWLVEHLLARWLHTRDNFYHLNASGTEPPNPEYRISDDSRWATEVLVDLGIGLLSALVGGIAFVSILWSVGGSLTLGGTTIPGYMVWLALAYGILASSLMAKVGKPLVGRVGTKNEAEGYFRFAMMRLRDNAESVAKVGGAGVEFKALRQTYDGVVARWLAIVRSHGHLTWITNASGPMIPIVPLLFAAPKYLAGDLSLGQVTQLAAAFIQVQIAISWVVDNYNRIAEWYASARRVMDIVDACERIERKTDGSVRHVVRDLQAGPDRSPVVALKNIVIADDAGRPLVSADELVAARGETVHVSGGSSTGKSTLAHIITGHAKPAAGHVHLPAAADVALLPQKVYVPLGSLRQAVGYPAEVVAAGSAEAALQRVGLADLVPRLDDVARWDHILTLGDLQRLGIARILCRRPDVAIIDDALSALEEPERLSLLAVLRHDLPDAIILSFGQRPLPAASATRQYVLDRRPAGTQLRPLTTDTPAYV